MTAPKQRSGGLDPNTRGIAVLVAAVVIGLLLLWKAGDSGTSAQVPLSTKTTTTVDTSNLDGKNTTTTPGTASTTTTSADGKQPADVSVLVLNASGPAGSAAETSQTIGAAGYKMGAPANANAGVTLTETAVYYADGFQAEATAVALLLGRTDAVVQPMPTPVPGPGADSANVVVVLGKNTDPTASGSTTTTPSASTTTAAN